VFGGASEKFLLEGETVDYQTRRHWAILLRPALQAGLSLLGLSILFGITGSNVVTALGGLAVLYLWGRLSWKIADWRVDNLYVTDWRVFTVSGMVTRRLAAMPLRKITDLTYETTLPGRVLGYGRFVIETAGQDQALASLAFVPDPHAMYTTLSHLTLHGPDKDRPYIETPRRPGDAPRDARRRRPRSTPVDPTDQEWIDRLFDEE
jgi:hypothetical protein